MSPVYAQAMTPLAVSHFTLVTALGAGQKDTANALRQMRSGLVQTRFETATFDAWIGLVDGLERLILPPELTDFDCRNNRLAMLGLQTDGFAEHVRQASGRYGARRIGVFLGTSTSGILHTEMAYRQRHPTSGALPDWLHYAQTQNSYSVAKFVRTALNLAGPSLVVSTACSSSAKVFGVAARWISAGLIDAAVVGGVDTLCLTTLYGFNALELLSPKPCQPWDAERCGLSLGEGAAFALLERHPQAIQAWLLGVGESSDGYHMSSPHPEGAGAAMAMRAALGSAGLRPEMVDYLNLHGTATPNNDAAEDKAVCTVFGPALSCSSTKAFTGHTLGAAGGVEAAISMLAMSHSEMPANLNLCNADPQLHANTVRTPTSRSLSVVGSNSFGFGGTNACLLFGAAK